MSLGAFLLDVTVEFEVSRSTASIAQSIMTLCVS